ncbi:MAG TPA: DUF2637 domain-containing protein [Acidimicrobiales bacterium]|nr:DUF2637 domain-containing protein [Acidimicrobiales bacterium]
MIAQEVLDLDPAEATPAELQAAARDAYRQAAATGTPPTGAELGRWFGRSGRWGRDRIAECRSTDNGKASAAIAALPADDRSTLAAPAAPPGSNGSHDAATSVDGEPNGSHVAATAVPPGNGESLTAATGMPEEMRSRRIIRWITTTAVIVVAACAARSSYEHQRTVVEMAGNPEAAWYLPLSVDGMMLVASLNMLVRRWDGHPAGSLTWTALLLGATASLAANIAAAPPTLIGRLVAAWSPICLAVSYELLMQQLPHRPSPEERRT